MRPADIQPLLIRFITATKHLRDRQFSLAVKQEMTSLGKPFYQELLSIGWPMSGAQIVLRQAFSGMFDKHLNLKGEYGIDDDASQVLGIGRLVQ